MPRPEQSDDIEDENETVAQGGVPASSTGRALAPDGAKRGAATRRDTFGAGITRLLRLKLIVPLRRGRHSPEYKARGCAVGLFWAFTPLVGIQMALVMMTWALFKPFKRWHFSPVIACAWTWVTNVFTMVPIYYGFYLTGQVIQGRFEDVTGYGTFSRAWNETFMADQSTADAMAAYSTWIAKEVGLAMAVGSVPYAIGFAWLGYRLALDYLNRRQVRRERLQKSSLPASSDGMP